MRPTSRRNFLRSTSGTALAVGTFPLLAWDEACQRTNLTTAQLQAFRTSIGCTVVYPIDTAYDQLRVGYNLRFAHFPMMIVQPTTLDHVKAAIAFASEHGIKLTAKGGGHSYCGWSYCDGMVLDFSQMKAIAFGTGNETVTIQPGAILIEMYEALSCQAQCGLPGGTCPTVGIPGYTLGGGYGPYSRPFGFMCDRLRRVTMVKADGTHLEAAVGGPNEHILKACRGGGGGSFGIITEFEFEPFQVNQVAQTGVNASSFEEAAGFFEVLQGFAPEIQAEATFMGSIYASPNFQGVGASVYGVPDASHDAQTVAMNNANELKHQMVKHGVSVQNIPPAINMTIARMALKTGFPNDSDLSDPTNPDNWICNLPDDDQIHVKAPPDHMNASSVYINEVMTQAGVTALVDQIKLRLDASTYGPHTQGTISLDSYGGTLGNEPEGGSVMVHRQARFVSQIASFWKDTTTDEHAQANVDWVNESREALIPHTSSGAYVNYCNETIEDWATAYWGDEYPFLQQIKQECDPQDFFRFAQSVRLPG